MTVACASTRAGAVMAMRTVMTSQMSATAVSGGSAKGQAESRERALGAKKATIDKDRRGKQDCHGRWCRLGTAQSCSVRRDASHTVDVHIL